MPVLVRINEGALPLSSLFSESDSPLFEIHPPQRRFKWKEQQIDQLWSDMLTAYRNNSVSYFLGTLLLVPIGNGRVSVIDGQQRISTLSILLAILRDHCEKFSGLKNRAGIVQRYISRVDNDGNPLKDLVVTLQEPDNEIYIKLVKQSGSTQSPSSVPPQNLLWRAVKRLRDHVEQHINVPNPEESLRGLCQYIQTKIMLLPLEVSNEGEGYLVFDTTNTRGLRLSPSEALKARLATIAREDRDLSDELINKWNSTATKLENAGLPIDAMDDYLHAVWCSKAGYITKRTLERIASKLTKADDLKDFVKELESYCESYLAVLAPSGDASITEDLKDLRVLNVQSYSLLTMVHKHSPSRFKEAVNLVLSLQIRNVTLGPFQAHEYEKSWPHWANLVRNGDADKAFDEIRSLMVADEEFQRSFDKATVASAGMVRHLLRRLDPISQPGSGVQPMSVDVEHVLPKSVVTKLNDDKNLTSNVRKWIEDLGYEVPKTRDEKRDLGKKLEPYLNMLGNQALLNDKTNRGAKDLPFAKKKDFYKTQALKLTNALVKFEKWGLDEIEVRQKGLAKNAPPIWPK